MKRKWLHKLIESEKVAEADFPGWKFKKRPHRLAIEWTSLKGCKPLGFRFAMLKFHGAISVFTVHLIEQKSVSNDIGRFREWLKDDRVHFYRKSARGTHFFRGIASTFAMFLHAVPKGNLCLMSDYHSSKSNKLIINRLAFWGRKTFDSYLSVFISQLLTQAFLPDRLW